MTMKHPRDNEDLPMMLQLLGSDHSKPKRQRTMSDASEHVSNLSIENKSSTSNNISSTTSNFNTVQSSNSNINSNININSHASVQFQTGITLRPLTPRPLTSINTNMPINALIDALMDEEGRQLAAVSSTNQAVSALLRQNQQQSPQNQQQLPPPPEFNFQPLIARPCVHKITEVSRSNANANAVANANHEIRDAPSPAPSKAPSQASKYDSIEANVNALVVEQYRAALAALAPTTPGFPNHSTLSTGKNSNNSPQTATTHSIVLGAGAPVLPLHGYLLPAPSTSSSTSVGSATSTTRYDATLLHHGSRPLCIRGPSARQKAIHALVHNDYKKIYKPLQRPPRLPTPQEALVIAAISIASAPCG